MIDIVELKNAKYLKFYVRKINGHTYIYCENTKTEETVVLQEID